MIECYDTSSVSFYFSFPFFLFSSQPAGNLSKLGHTLSSHSRLGRVSGRRKFSFLVLYPFPVFFPDLPIVTVLLLIFENAQKALICFALLQTILFAVLMERFWIFVREEKKGKSLSHKETRRVGSWVLLLISFLLLASKNFPTLYIVFLPSIHASAFLVTLYAWPLIHKTFQKRQVWTSIVWITFTVASDRILFVELIVPGILAGFLFPSDMRKRVFPESSRILIVSGIAGLILHARTNFV